MVFPRRKLNELFISATVQRALHTRCCSGAEGSQLKTLGGNALDDRWSLHCPSERPQSSASPAAGSEGPSAC